MDRMAYLPLCPAWRQCIPSKTQGIGDPAIWTPRPCLYGPYSMGIFQVVLSQRTTSSNSAWSYTPNQHRAHVAGFTGYEPESTSFEPVKALEGAPDVLYVVLTTLGSQQ